METESSLPYSQAPATFCFSRGGVLLALRPNPQAGGPHLVGCPRVLIQFIRSYPPYQRPFLHPQPEDASCRGDRDPQTRKYKLFILFYQYRAHEYACERILYSKLYKQGNTVVKRYGYSLTQLLCTTLGLDESRSCDYGGWLKFCFCDIMIKGIITLVSSKTKVLTSPFYFINNFPIILTDTLTSAFATFLQLQILQATLMLYALWKDKNAGMFFALVIALYLSVYDIMLTVGCVTSSIYCTS